MTPLQFSVYPNQHRASYDLPALKPLRPPIYNPFDKFPQPEFDAWIGDLTNALKGALGRLDDAGQQQTLASPGIGNTPVFADDVVEDVADGSSIDDEVEDSFADMKARRVIRKGKARDPREGPGFGTGLGERHLPIEIGSDSDELEEDGESEAGSERWEMEEQDGEDDDERDEEGGEEDEEEEDEESVEEEDQSWLQGESSIQARIRSEGDMNDHYEYQDGGENEEDYELDERSDVEYEAIGRPQKRESPEEVILLSSDEEPDGDEGACRKDVADDYDGHSDQSDAEEAPAIVSRSSPLAMNNPDQDEIDTLNGELEYHEASYEADGKGDVDIDDEQPVDEDTSFPSPTIFPTMFQQPVDIPDPWSGPKTYAEDFYSGGDVLPSSDGQIIPDNLGIDDDQNGNENSQSVPSTPGKHDSEEQIMREDVHKSHSPLLASDSQDIDMLEVYSDIEVDSHGYQQEEFLKQTDISAAEEHHALEFSDDGTSFTVGSSEMLQEATYTDPSELSSHHIVNERPEVEASVTQEPVVDEVEILTPLVATSDLEYNAKPWSSPVIVDIEEISSSTPESPFPVATEHSKEHSEESSALPQHHIFGGLPTPELDDVPTTIDEPQTPGYFEVAQQAVAEPSADVPGSPPNPETGKQIDDLVTKSADKNEMPDIPAPDSEYQQDPSELPKDTEQTSTGMHRRSHVEAEITPARHLHSYAEEHRAGASTNDLQAHTELGSSSPVEEPRLDINVLNPMTTIPLTGNAEVFNIYDEPVLNTDRPVAVAGPHILATTPIVADSVSEHSVPAEALIGLAGASKVVEERYTAQALAHTADQASDKASHSSEKSLVSSSDFVDHHATSSGNRDGQLGPGDQEGLTDNRELPHSAVHDTVLISPSYTLPPASYPTRMVMRKATDPVLFADPYPYSLSTPGQTQDEISDDEETERAYSLSSSSTFDKYSDNTAKEGDVITASEESAQRNDLLKLQSPLGPVEVDNPGSCDTRQPDDGPEQRNANSDTDADGDVDLEFTGTDATSSPAHSSSTRGYGVIEDPFRDAVVTSSANRREDKAVELGGVKRHVEPAAEQQNSHSLTTATTRIPSISRPAGELPAIFLLRKKPVEEIQNSGSAEAPSSEQLPEDLIPATRSSKRKRDKSPDALTRTASSKKQERSSAARQVAHRPRKSDQDREAQPVKSHKHSAGKGKGKASQSKSHNTSRASSIVSSAPSDKSSQSIYMHPSPTIDKVTALRPQMPPPLLHLLHTHSRAVSHHHSLPSPISQLPVQRSAQKNNSIARHIDSPRSAGATPPYHPHRSSSFSGSSPVTRSHCRYHKISIPRDEDDGPREYFLVPGCSLGNADLISEELIEDHGDATPDDADRSVNDIASLEGLNPYLVGIMRQLVGLDRDQEVYYVPPHGQEPVRSSRHPKTPSDKLPLARVPSHDQMTATSANGSFRSPTSSKAPLSTSGSVSTSASFPRKEMDFDPPSAMSSPGSDLSDGDGSPLKRARASLTGDKVPGVSASRVSSKKRTRVPEAIGEPDVHSPRLKKQKTHSNDETVGNVVSPM